MNIVIKSILALYVCNVEVQDEELMKRAKEIHERVITLDTHIDILPENFTKEKNYGMRLDRQVDLYKMEEGGLDVGFFVVYVGQGPLTEEGYKDAYKKAMEKFNAIRRMTNELNSDRIGLALKADDVASIIQSGKKVAVICVENGYSLGDDLSRVKEFYDLGARYISITHNGHTQFGDSNTNKGEGPEELYGGLSDLGKELIKKLNYYGIMVDISHASMKTAIQAMKLSKAPVIASHSGGRALCNHTRNLTDEALMALKRNGGVIQVVAFREYLVEDPEGKIRKGKDRVHADVGDLVDHIDYVVEKIGIDHVGISSDFNGGGGIEGWSNAGETFNVTLELVKRGYTEEQIHKIWSGNLLRVWREVERVAEEMQSESK